MKNFLHEGWQVVHRVASRLAACDFDDDSGEIPCVYLEQWSHFVFSIPGKLGYGVDRGELPYQAFELGEFIYRELCQRARKEKTPIKSGLASTKHIYDEIVATKSVTTAFDIIRRDKGSEWREFDQNDHFSIVQSGIAEIRWAMSDDKSSPVLKIIRGLTLIGVGHHTWKIRVRCAHCFRIAASGKKYCQEHVVDHDHTIGCQSFNQDVKHHRGARAAAAMKKKEDIRWTRYCDNIFLNIDQVFINFIYPPLNEQDWRKMQPDPHDPNNFAIQTAKFNWDILMISLYRTIFVKRILGDVPFENLSVKELVELCRLRLDPWDYDSSLSHWSTKVGIAELWFEVEASVSAPNRGATIVNSDRLQQAILLARHGHAKSEIAEKLKVKRSTFSNWIKRYPKLSEAFNPT